MNQGLYVDTDRLPERFVYVVSDSTGSECKIGTTDCLERRLPQLWRERGAILIPVLLVEAGFAFEKELHQHFHRKARGREWFDLGNDDIKEIVLICRDRGIVVVEAWPVRLADEYPQIPKSCWKSSSSKPKGVDALALMTDEDDAAWQQANVNPFASVQHVKQAWAA